jgi:D-amino-acid dehydrogenase
VSAPDGAVVGGGAIGVCCARELARRGASVTLLEAGAELGAGCSAGNAGLLCPSHVEPIASRAALLEGLRALPSRDSPLALRPRPGLVPWLLRFAAACTPARERAATAITRELSAASLALHAELARAHGTGVERRGTLNVYETGAGFERGRREAARNAAAGLPNEVLDGAAATAFEPALQGPVAGAILYPDDMSGDPLAFVQAVGRAASGAGAELRCGSEVLGLRLRGGRIEALDTTRGRLRAGTVVLAAGVWSPRVVRGTGLSLPVQGAKGYHLDHAPLAGDPQVPVYLQEARVVLTPLPGRLRLAGVFDLAGLDDSVDQRRLAAVQRAGERRIRGLAGREPVHVWRGLRPCAPDGLPILGRTRRLENLVLATAHAMLGFTLAPVSGRLVAQLLAGEPPAHPLALLDPDRFTRRAR